MQAGMTACPECGHTFTDQEIEDFQKGPMGAPGMPKAPGAPGMPKAPGMPAAPGMPKAPGAK